MFGEALQRCLIGLTEASRSVAILFSGGVDSLLIALLAQRFLPAHCFIDLINVSFDEKSGDFSGAPDRRRGLKAYSYLKKKYLKSLYRLILVNVGRTELSRCRSESIAFLIAPSCSVLDDSIGCVQWFAAKGEGLVYEEDRNIQEMKSVASVALVGSGADEVFGGYMRHRHAYDKGDRDAVIDGLEEELRVIGRRNLGRDDRVTLETLYRAPYLDEIFVSWANQLPLECKTDFKKERGVGEKKIIREALKRLGVPEELYSAPKQAMQFGTRIAHLENSKEKGSDVCLRLVPCCEKF
ncbi:unnamed protein product [Enterobius vermicularis]|uniref:Asparagine synthetase domain-containing protein n=1 Tax=Enterobius vermicularis TaxID=51028 RepID=A0A0N4V569_ENTVE|nr:unnamed protein product [Enterobius vermicularis]